MKKFLILAVISVLMISVFVACGGTGDEMMDDLTTVMEGASTALDNIADDLTENGNVTEEETTKEETTGDMTTEGETSEENTSDVTQDETKQRSILDDITE